MLIWIALLFVLALLAAGAGCTVVMLRAERRARRNLYRTLGVSEETVNLLMARNSDVQSSLALVRIASVGSADSKGPLSDPPMTGLATSPFRRAAIRLVHPAADQPVESDPTGEQARLDRGHRR
jgi:hypothetical protein